MAENIAVPQLPLAEPRLEDADFPSLPLYPPSDLCIFHSWATPQQGCAVLTTAQLVSTGFLLQLHGSLRLDLYLLSQINPHGVSFLSLF